MKDLRNALILFLLFSFCNISNASVPDLTFPNDMSNDVSLTTNLTWSATGGSYTVEVYSCNPDYSKVGKFLTQSGTFTKDFGPTVIAGVDDDFSGITYNEDSETFFAVINGNCEIIELDANGGIIRNIELEHQKNDAGNYLDDGNPNNSFDDTEGIVWIGGNDFFVTEEREGRVTKINIPNGATYIPYVGNYIQLTGPGWNDNQGVEGIGYNPATNELTIVKEWFPIGLYKFQIPTSLPSSVAVTSANAPNLTDLSGVHHFANSSAVSNMNINNHFLIVSQEDGKIIEMDEDGNSYGELLLTDITNNGGEPEGVTIDKFGNIYVAAEINQLYKYSAPLNLNPFGLASTTTFVNNNVTTESITIPAGQLFVNTEYCWRVKDNATNAWSDYSSFTTVEGCPDDRNALIAFYNSAISPNSYPNWDLTQPMSTWGGVTLNANGCVDKIYLEDYATFGTLPPEIGDFAEITYFEISSSLLNGPIPPEIGNLTTLTTLDLSTNQLTGSIPGTLGNLTNLTFLRLNSNQLSGCYDDNLLNLCNTPFTGNGNISFGNNFPMTWEDFCAAGTCTEGCDVTDREALIAVYNAANGANSGLSWDLTQPMSTWEGVTLNANGCVTELSLFEESLTGYLAPEIGNLVNLTKLDLIYNSLQGPIPAEIGNLTNLTQLYLGYNQFTGGIPAALGNLTNLTSMNVNFNLLSGCYDINLQNLCGQLTGWSNTNAAISDGNNFDAPWENFCATGNCTLPPSCAVTDRDALIAFYNAAGGANTSLSWDLTQPMSTWEGVTLDANGCVSILDLDEEYVTGFLAPEIGNLSSITILSLTGINMQGTLPAELGNLTTLTHLFLGANQFTGSIPAELANLTNLTALGLSNNPLTGCYDPALQSLCSQLSSSNGAISFGTNLTIPWEYFCVTGDCTPSPCSVSDRNALTAFYNNVTDWGTMTPWDLTQNMQNWQGVTVNNIGCVTSLNIGNYSMTGSIPPELGDLNELTYLYLGGITLTGGIPPEIGNLNNLTSLTLTENDLTGTIPPEIGNLTNLEILTISHGNLTGAIPPELGNLTNLVELSLRGSQLTGPIPPELGNLTNLVDFDMGWNQIGGSLPPELGNLTNLTSIELRQNQLTGSIPPEFGNLTNLTFWVMYDNMLSGVIPTELGNLINLDVLSLSDNGLTGFIPPSLCNLNSLSQLYLFNNNFVDNIPACLGPLPQANLIGTTEWFDFCYNNSIDCGDCSETDYYAMEAIANSITNWGSTTPWDLTQPMSTWDGVTLHPDGCVKAINFDENYTSGTLPPEIGNLSRLEILDLGDNNYSGPIPPELGNLTNLVHLNFDGNSFSGTIPPQLGNLTNLTEMYFTYNQLSGSIPATFGNLVNLSSLSLKYNNLTGSLPPELGNLINLHYLSLNDNQLSGSIPSTFGNIPLYFLALYNNQLSGCYPNEMLNFCGRNPNTNTNFYISDGNNFDAPWEDFCSGGLGACMPVDCPNEQDQYAALRAFYLSTDGDNWGNNNYWPDAAFFNANPTLPPNLIAASWYGIEVNTEGCVTYMNFDEDYIGGTIPPEFGNLIYLEYLDLGANDIAGTIPASFGNLSSLKYLMLSSNNLTGSIPSTFGNLTSLETVFINFNQLSGSIPSSIGNLTELKTLALRSNQLTGSIPSTIGNLTNLTGLGLSNNQLTGSLPSSLGNITSLTGLSLKNNNLSGCYPSNYSNLCSQLISYYNSNALISDGNNFDAAWEDFCINATGACDDCPSDLLLSSDPLDSDTYQASSTLCSESTILAGEEVEFMAGDEVILGPGFNVELGGAISIETGVDCE